MEKINKIKISAVLLITLIIGCLNYSTKMNSQGKISLPKPNLKNKVSVEEAIGKRRSVRNYSDKPLTLEQLGQILWAAQGTTGQKAHHRAAPSAGGIHPLELYVISTNVSNLQPGTYKYNSIEHSLKMKHSKNKKEEIHKAAYQQPMILKAPAILVFSAIFQKTMTKYGPEAKNFVYAAYI